MRTFCLKVICLCFILILAGCAARNGLAPVSELRWHPFSRFHKSHTVVKGETLYAISFRYDTDFRTLARVNHLRPPYSLRVGQVLDLRGIHDRVAPKPSYRRQRPSYRQAIQAVHRPIFGFRTRSGWLWPTNGRVVASFVPTQGKKGINIACNKGDKVVASSGGVVAYAGSGLAGYGNLIIIKHNNEYLTAYGNNARNLVSEGQRVKSGQIIAEAGIIDRKYWGVHFEIRKKGIPVNPLNYLQKG